ncbi:MAG: type II toxin-antitoxin system VapC family toxin [Rhizobiaceae bacterium]
MIFYLDTSFLVTAIVEEAASEAVWKWLDDNRHSELFVSDWVVTEFSSALSVKVRTGQLSAGGRLLAARMFSRLQRASLDFIPVESRHFSAAANLCANPSTGLRGGDALHLSLAGDVGSIVTRDRILAQAAFGAGIDAILL